MHEHEFQGQKLRHEHEHGGLPHGYYEHPEDGHRPAAVIECGDCGGELIVNPDAKPTGEVTIATGAGSGWTDRQQTTYSASHYLHADDRSPQCAGRADADRRRARQAS